MDSQPSVKIVSFQQHILAVKKCTQYVHTDSISCVTPIIIRHASVFLCPQSKQHLFALMGDIGWITLQDYLQDVIPAQRRTDDRSDRKRSRYSDSDAVSDYIKTMGACAEVEQVSSDMVFEMMKLTEADFTASYGERAAFIDDYIRTLHTTVAREIIVRGFCILLLTENNTALYSKPVTESQWADYLRPDYNTVVASSDKSTAMDGHSSTNIYWNTREVVAPLDFEALQRDSVIPVYKPCCEFASFVYVSPLGNSVRVNTEAIEAASGMKDAHCRLVVVGFRGVRERPIGVSVAEPQKCRAALYNMCTGRANEGDALTVLLVPQRYKDMAQTVGSEEEYAETVHVLGGQDNVRKLNTNLLNMLRMQMDTVKESMENQNEARVRIVTSVPGVVPSFGPILPQDTMAATLIRQATDDIYNRLGIISPVDNSKHRASAFNTIASMQRLLSVTSGIILQLVSAANILFGIEFPDSVFSRLMPQERMKTISDMALYIAFTDNAIDGKYLSVDKTKQFERGSTQEKDDNTSTE